MKPCLFSKGNEEQARCGEEYTAAGLGSEERGILAGEEVAGNRRLTTFQNRIRNTGSIEIDGKPYKTFPNVKSFHLKSRWRAADIGSRRNV